MIRTRSGTSDKLRHAPEITAPTMSEPIGRGTVGGVAGVRQVASHRTVHAAAPSVVSGDDESQGRASEVAASEDSQ